MLEKGKELKTERIEIEDETRKCISKHQKYTTKLKDIEKEGFRSEGILEGHNVVIKSSTEMKKSNSEVKERLEKAVDYADTEVAKIESNIGGHATLSDLKSNLKRTESSLQATKTDLKNENESIKDKVNQQKELCMDNMNQASEFYIDASKDCKQFIQAS